MKQEEKELLLKDLCGRLPYGVVVHTDDKDIKLDRNHRGLLIFTVLLIMAWLLIVLI